MPCGVHSYRYISITPNIANPRTGTAHPPPATGMRVTLLFLPPWVILPGLARGEDTAWFAKPTDPGLWPWPEAS